MNKILSACVLIFSSTALPVFADDSPKHCSVATLHDTYGFADTGMNGPDPYSTSGMESYDGEGNIKYTQLWHQNGVTKNYNGAGKITITADCIANALYDPGNTWTYFVAPDGSRFYYYNNNPGTLIQAAGHEDRISRALLLN